MATQRQGTAHAAHVHRDHRSERQLMLLLFAVSYPLCLISAIVSRIMSLFGGRRPAGERRNVFAEARSAAYAAVGYAFHA